MGFGMTNGTGKTGYYAKRAYATANEASTTATEALELAEEAIERIEARVIKTLPTQDGTLTYDGTEQSPTWNNVSPGSLTFGGVLAATNAGSYTATCTPAKGYKWEDGKVDPKNIVWTIGRQVIYDTPTQTGVLEYDGTEKTPTFANVDDNKMTMGGVQAATNVGTYNATATPKSNYQWPDGSVDAKYIPWSIIQEALTVPAQSGTVTYDGTAQSPTLDSSYDSTKMTLLGDTTGTNAGTYTLTVSLTDATNYRWADGTATDKTVAWTIDRQAITTVPTQNPALTYNNTTQTVTWANYDSDKLTLSGTTTGTDAGNYTAVFTPKSNYQWSDSDATDPKEVTWSIGKAAGSVTLSPATITLDTSTLTDTITVTRTGDGAISAVSSDTSIATVSLSGNTITVTAVATGSVTVTVSVAAGTNWLAPTDATCAVAVQLRITKPLNELTPAEIQEVVNGGYAADVWDIGDKTAAITLSGNVSDGLTLSNYTCHAVLIGLDHNKWTETSDKSSAHFILGKDTSNKDIAFCDFTGQSYPDKMSGIWFNHSNASSNAGGWKSSNIRTNIMPKFIAALPAAWQSVLGTVMKETDNTGGGSDTKNYVKSTSDKMFLLAEFEVFGKRTFANSYEKNNQEQYAYYANGNSRVRYNHQTISSDVKWWLRSVRVSNSYEFCHVYDYDGHIGASPATYDYGVAPCFAIVKND